VLRARFDALVERATTPSAIAWVATASAESARIDGFTEPEAWARAIDAWDAVPDPAEAAYARYRAAETALRRTGVKADVAAQLQSAWRSATRLGAAPLRDDIELLARRARVKLESAPSAPGADEPSIPEAQPVGGPRPVVPGHGLSDREIEVLRLVAAGRSNGEIADRLFITRKTAGVHVTHILNKLGVSNRVEAAMAAARLGLVDAAGAGGDDDELEGRSD
jgi:DNA-binding CsgD family transcriptional regulator